MLKINIATEYDTKEELAAALNKIASLVEEGYTSGYYPTWDIEGDEEEGDGN